MAISTDEQADEYDRIVFVWIHEMAVDCGTAFRVKRALGLYLHLC